MAVDLTDVSDEVVDQFVDAAENVFNNGIEVLVSHKAVAKIMIGVAVVNAATYGVIVGGKKLYERYGPKAEEKIKAVKAA